MTILVKICFPPGKFTLHQTSVFLLLWMGADISVLMVRRTEFPTSDLKIFPGFGFDFSSVSRAVNRAARVPPW